MKVIQATLSFYGEVHSVMIHCSDEQWADPHFRTKLKDRLECNPTVLRLAESLERDYKSELKAAQAEVKSLAKQVADLTKRVATEDGEQPCFAILKP